MIRRFFFNPLGSRVAFAPHRSHTTHAPHVGHGTPENDGNRQASPTPVTPFSSSSSNYTSGGGVQSLPQWYDSSISHSTPIPNEWVPLLEGHRARNLLDSNRWLNRAQARIIGKPYYGSSRLPGPTAPNYSHKAVEKNAKLVALSESLSSTAESSSSSSQNSVSKNASKSQSAKKETKTATTSMSSTTTLASTTIGEEEDAYDSFGKIFIQDQQSATGKSWGSRGAISGSPSFNVGNVGVQVPLVGVPRKSKTVFLNELSSDLQMHLWIHHPLPAALLASPNSSSTSSFISCGKAKATEVKDDMSQTQDENSSIKKENGGHGEVTIADYPCVTAGVFQQPVWVLDLTYMEESGEPNYSPSSPSSSTSSITEKKTATSTSTPSSTICSNKIGKEFETRYASWQGGQIHQKSGSSILEDDNKNPTEREGMNDASTDTLAPSSFVRPLNFNDRSLLPLCKQPFLDRKVFLGVLRPEVWRTCLGGEDQPKKGSTQEPPEAKKDLFAASTPLEKLRNIIVSSLDGGSSFSSSKTTVSSSSPPSSSSAEWTSSLFFDPTKAHDVLKQVYERREEFLARDAALPSPFGWTGAEIDGGTSKTDNGKSAAITTMTTNKNAITSRPRFFFWRPATHEELHEALLFYAATTSATVPTDMILVKSKYFSEKASHLSQVTTIYNAQETTDPFSLDKTLVHRHALTNEPLPDRLAAGLTSAFSLRRFRNLRWLPAGEVGAELNTAAGANSTNTNASQKVVSPAGGARGAVLPFRNQHNNLAMASSCWRPLSDESPVIVEVKQEVALLHISQLPSEKLQKRLLSRLPSHFVGKSYAPIIRWGFNRWRAERSLTTQVERFFEKVDEYNKELERKAGGGPHMTLKRGGSHKNGYGALRVEAAKNKRFKEIIEQQQLAQQKLLIPTTQHTKQKKKRLSTGKGEDEEGSQRHHEENKKSNENGTIALSSLDNLLPLRLPHYPPISIVESIWFHVDHLHDIFPASEVPSLESIGSPVPFVYAYPCPHEFYNIEQLAYVPVSGRR